MKVNYRGQKVEVGSQEFVSEKDGVKTYLMLLKLPTSVGGFCCRAAYAEIDEKGKITIKEGSKRKLEDNSLWKMEKENER